MLNPYEANLDLTDKDDRKLFTDASKGLKEEYCNTGGLSASVKITIGVITPIVILVAAVPVVIKLCYVCYKKKPSKYEALS